MQRALPLARRLATVQQMQGSVASVQQMQVRCGHFREGWKPVTELVREQLTHMDTLPVPKGSWQEYKEKRNKSWTPKLILSVIVCTATWLFYWYSPSRKCVRVPNYKSVKVNIPEVD